VLVLVMLASLSAIRVESATERHAIHLQSVVFDPLVDGEPAAPSGLAPQGATSSDYYLVQFRGPVDPVSVDQIEELGGTVLGYIPENTHLMRIAPDALERIRTHPAVRWIGPHRPAYKIGPELLPAQLAIQAAQGEAEPLRLFVAGYADGSETTFAAGLRAVGATEVVLTMTRLGPTAVLTLSRDRLGELLAQPAVAWVEREQPLTTNNAEGRKIMGADSIWDTQGYFGEGQIVAISDSGLSVQNALSPDFAGRLVRAFAPSEMNISAACRNKTDWTDLNGHGSHVAGSVLGNGVNGGSNPQARQFAASPAGVAPLARLVFMALNTDGSTGIQCVSPNGDFITKGYEQGARISSNSWGGPTGGSAGQVTYGGYDFKAQLVDDYLWRNRDYLVLFAAGNAGPNRDTIGSPGTAKNILTVGASENLRPDVLFGSATEATNPGRMASFSSRGPTDDGRIKPEIVAPGTTVLSVRAEQAAQATLQFYGRYQPQPPNQNYAYSRGTSMATPLAAGAATLVREWLVKDRRLTNPTAALLKALMVHGAAQLPGAATPNQDSGWGRVDLKSTINARYAVLVDNLQGLTTGQTARYEVNVVSTSAAGVLAAYDTQLALTMPAGISTLSFAAEGTTAPADAPVAGDLRRFANAAAVPGYEAPPPPHPIPDTAGEKPGSAPSAGRLTPPAPGGASPALGVPSEDDLTTASLVTSMVGGGDFEDPGWTETWRQVWLGEGLPLRTIAGTSGYGGVALNGQSSIWLGGSPSNDSIWYPVSFPPTIANDAPSRLRFLIQMRDLDPTYDFICAAITDTTGSVIRASDGPIQTCWDSLNPGQTFVYDQVFTAAQRAALAGKDGYLALYNTGDALPPHTSGFVDDVSLQIDFADVTLGATPTSGPPGTTFLLSGRNNVPYGAVDVCSPLCGPAQNTITTVYADARGDVAAYLTTTANIPPGSYPVQTRNVAGRIGQTTLTIIGGTPTLSVSPDAGPPGTRFQFSGTNFLPNDTQITVQLNGQTIGTASSNANGALSFSITTRTDTPPGTYTLVAADRSGRSATAAFTVQPAATEQPTLTVSPTSGPPGTSFQFTGQRFAPNASVSFSIDGQAAGQTQTDAAGAFVVTLNTTSETRPGAYTFTAAQGAQRATVEYRVTEGGGSPQSGSGLFVTLAWTDPPAQVGAARTLVNNLDLTVTGPDGRVVRGNGGTTADSVNPIETVRLDRPAVGTYIITVTATSVNGTFGAQPFALVATTGQSFSANGSDTSLATERSLFLPLIGN
jgi:hypothetical protein